MSTRKSSLVLFALRIKAFRLYIGLPLRCLAEVTDGFSDLLCLFKRASWKGFAGLMAMDDAIAMLRDCGPLDLVDVNVDNMEIRVKVKLLLR